MLRNQRIKKDWSREKTQKNAGPPQVALPGDERGNNKTGVETEARRWQFVWVVEKLRHVFRKKTSRREPPGLGKKGAGTELVPKD